jgi:hypothetical protein
MKFVRTVRGYEALTVTHEGKELTAGRVASEVSDDAAKALEKAAEQTGVQLEVTDQAPEARAVGSVVNVGSGVDLASGVAAISGGGAPVLTREAPAPAKGDEPELALPDLAEESAPVVVGDGATTTTTTRKKG